MLFAGNETGLRRNDPVHGDQPLRVRRHRHVPVPTRLGTADENARSGIDDRALPLAPRAETQTPRAGKVPSRWLHRIKPNPSSGPPKVDTVTAPGTHVLHPHPLPRPWPQETVRPFPEVHLLRNRCGSHLALLDSLSGPIPTVQTPCEATFLGQRQNNS